MYWFRTGSALALLPWLGLTGIWWAGGWLLATHAFRLPRRERFFVGFGLGLGVFLFLSNLLAYLIPIALAFLVASLTTLGLGLAFALPGHRSLLRLRDMVVWQPVAGALLLSWVFLKISQGVGLFDEFIHLPVISTLAAGNFPPQSVGNSQSCGAYHYGFHLLGASLMRLGGLFPWSAFDLSKSILWGYATVLAWLAGRRFLAHRLAGPVAAAAILFAGGARYLLLLLPSSWLDRLGGMLALSGNEALLESTLSEMLSASWLADGAPPVDFLFAFMSGVADPLSIAHAGLHILHVILLFLVLLLAGRMRSPISFLVLVMLFGLWALVWETSYLLFVLGGTLASLHSLRLHGWRLWTTWPALPLAAALLLSVPVALLQGGVLTELARLLLSGSGPAVSGFALRWPPALISRHLGPLSLFSPLQLLAALFEWGFVILFTPWITRWAWRKFQAGLWAFGALIVSAWLGFLIPIFFTHRLSSDLARLSGHAVLVWIFFLALMLLDANATWRQPVRSAAGLVFGLTLVSGMVSLGVALTAAPRVVLAYRYDKLDAQTSAATWDQLPSESEIFDPAGGRATVLTGRLTRANSCDDLFGAQPHPTWLALSEDPDVASLLENGYRFVYVDEKWWNGLLPSGRAVLSRSCVRMVSEHWDDAGLRFRQILDLEGCQRSP